MPTGVWFLKIERSFEAAHCIQGHGKCGEVHGHTYVAEVEVAGYELEDNGWIWDFDEFGSCLDDIIKDLDHHYLNDIVEPSTAEVIAKYIFNRMRLAVPQGLQVISVSVKEGDGGTARYVR